MCNIAGYVGDRRAAPILIEMIRRQESLNGGHYTGLATIHEGKLYYAKLVGDLDRLLKKTGAADFPGTIGVVHSRTPGKEGDEWAHPFIGGRNGEARSAFVINGFTGYFNAFDIPYGKFAEEVLAAGYTLRSREKLDHAYPTTLSDGTSAHGSDVLCQMIQQNIDNGADEASAMEQAFTKRPGEFVGLLLSLAHPDRVFWSRVDMPMFAGYAPHGAYLASAALAFPDDAGAPLLLPPLSSGEIRADGFTARAYQKPLAKIAPIDARVMHDAYEAISAALREEKQTVKTLVPVVRPLFEKADCSPNAAVIYEVLRALSREGKLRSEIVRVPGSAEGLTAPVCKFSLRAVPAPTVSAPTHSK